MTQSCIGLDGSGKMSRIKVCITLVVKILHDQEQDREDSNTSGRCQRNEKLSPLRINISSINIIKCYDNTKVQLGTNEYSECCNGSSFSSANMITRSLPEYCVKLGRHPLAEECD